MADGDCRLKGPQSDGMDSGVRGAGRVYGWREPFRAAQCIGCRVQEEVGESV